MAVRRSPNGRWNVFKAWTRLHHVCGRGTKCVMTPRRDWQFRLRARRFAPPWSVEELENPAIACPQQFDVEPGQRPVASHCRVLSP